MAFYKESSLCQFLCQLLRLTSQLAFIIFSHVTLDWVTHSWQFFPSLYPSCWMYILPVSIHNKPIFMLFSHAVTSIMFRMRLLADSWQSGSSQLCRQTSAGLSDVLCVFSYRLDWRDVSPEKHRASSGPWSHQSDMRLFFPGRRPKLWLTMGMASEDSHYGPQLQGSGNVDVGFCISFIYLHRLRRAITQEESLRINGCLGQVQKRERRLEFISI